MRKLQKMSIIWKEFLLLLSILVVSLLSLVISVNLLESNQRKFLEDKIELQVNKNCDKFSRNLYQTHAIPKAIENTKYYNYIRSITDGHYPEKYISILPLINKSLMNQAYLYEGAEECILIFKGSGSAVARGKCFVDYRECFNKYINFSHISAEEVENCLNSSESIIFLESQETIINNQSYGNCLSLLIKPVLTSTSVLTIYQEDKILNMLDFDLLPDNTYMELSRADGTLLMTHGVRSKVDINTKTSYHTTVILKELHATVTYWIPNEWFSYMSLPMKRIGIGLVLITFLFGFLLCIKLSGISTKPLRDLVKNHIGNEAEYTKWKTNEIQSLSAYIEQSKEKIDILQGSLEEQLLLRVSLGIVLSEKENSLLDAFVREKLKSPYRLAVFYVPEDFDQNEIVYLFVNCFQKEFIYQFVNQAEGIIIFSDDKVSIELLKETWSKWKKCLSEVNDQSKCHLGISNSFFDVAHLYSEITQARNSIIDNESPIEEKNNRKKYAMNWNMHERLYQRLLANDEINTYSLFENISQYDYHGKTGEEVFYNILFVMRSAADELGFDLKLIENIEYDWNLSFRNNIMSLISLLDEFHSAANFKKQSELNEKNNQIISYIQSNYCDDTICLAKVSDVFSISEKNVQSIIRRETGVSVGEYITILRMRRAASLLCTTSKDILEIATSCGYISESSFYRTFKKFYKKTPNQYRQGL